MSESWHGFLDAVAARRPTPGGGSVAAAAAALAAAMARMVAAYSPGPDAGPAGDATVRGAAGELAQADAMLRRLVDEDAAAYQAYAQARKASNPAERERVAGLVLAVPMETAAVACSVLRTLDQCKEHLNRNLISDLGVAALLAEAAVRAAATIVRINLKVSPESDPRGEVRREIQDMQDHAGALASSIAAFVARASCP